MQRRITDEEIETAARQLATNDQGRIALQKLSQLMNDGRFELDLLNQRAFLALLGGVWTDRAQQVREAMTEALGQGPIARV